MTLSYVYRIYEGIEVMAAVYSFAEAQRLQAEYYPTGRIVARSWKRR